MLNRKAWAQLLVAIATAIWAALTDNSSTNMISNKEWIVIVNTALGAFLVWVVPNLEAGLGRFSKGFVSFATAGLGVLYVVIDGGLTTAELIEVLVAGAAAIGLVTALGNKGYVFAQLRGPVQPAGPPPL